MNPIPSGVQFTFSQSHEAQLKQVKALSAIAGLSDRTVFGWLYGMVIRQPENADSFVETQD